MPGPCPPLLFVWQGLGCKHMLLLGDVFIYKFSEVRRSGMYDMYERYLNCQPELPKELSAERLWASVWMPL